VKISSKKIYLTQIRPQLKILDGRTDSSGPEDRKGTREKTRKKRRPQAQKQIFAATESMGKLRTAEFKAHLAKTPAF
jgi:hypothetical protein